MERGYNAHGIRELSLKDNSFALLSDIYLSKLSQKEVLKGIKVY